MYRRSWQIGLALLMCSLSAVSPAWGAAGAASAPAATAAAAAAPSWWAYGWLVGGVVCMAGMVLAYRACSKPEYHRESVLVGAYLTSCVVSIGFGYWRSGSEFHFRAAESLSSTLLPLGVVGGLLVVMSAEMYLRSTNMGPMSITWTIRQMESVPATLVSILFFAGEYTLFRVMGIFLLIPALCIFGWDKRIQEARQAALAAANKALNAAPRGTAAEAAGTVETPTHKSSPWMLYAILSAVSLGSYRILALWVHNDQIPQFMLFMYASCVLFALGKVVLDRHRIAWPEFNAGAFLGLLSSIQLFCSLNSQTTVGKVVTLGTLAVSVPVVVTLLSVGMYNEKIHWRSWLGLAVALGALTCMFLW